MAGNNEANTTRFYLNALKRTGNSLSAPKRGIWNPNPNFLARYVESVDVTGELTADRSTHSVPSVFQRPILFYQALRDASNPLHRAIRAEWRGLMATLCLARWLDLHIETVPFRVPQITPKATSTVGATPPGDLHFGAMLRNQLPLRTALDTEGREIQVTDWEDWWLIRCGGAVVGATSPWTLLYTSSQPKAPDSIPWQRQGRLIDPIAHYDPRRERSSFELSLLCSWVQALLAGRGDWKLPDHLAEHNNLIYSQLVLWAADLDRYKNADLRIVLGDSLFPGALFSSIVRPPGPVDGEQSELLLNSDKPGRPVLVLSTQLDRQRRVLRGIFSDRIDYENLKSEGEQFQTKNLITLRHSYIVPEKLFFPPRLLRIANVKKALTTDAGDISIPLTSAFFRYFNYENLDRVKLSRSGSGYTAQLTIPVSGGDPIVVTRKYEEKDVVSLSGDFPGFALWPDSEDPEWIENFAAYTAAQGVDLQVRPLLANGQLLPDAAWADPHQKLVRIWTCPSMPVGFALETPLEKGGRLEAGLLLRKKLIPPRPLDARESWSIGVDFGTSSTMVMVDRGQGPEDMTFHGRGIFLAGGSDAETQIANNLYPTTEITPPFRTLLYRSAATIFNPLVPPYTLRFTTSPQDILQTVADVKWGSQTRDGGASPLFAYLEALVRYIMWEARMAGVQTVHFLWSYPRSLPAGSFRIMEDFWQGRVRHNYSRHGIVVGDVHGISESEAACRAFANAKATVASSGLSITVDIGGGSTDIAFWSANELRDQVSFKVAGNDILDPTYLKESALREILHICFGNHEEEPYLQNIAQREAIYLNGALTEAKKNGIPFRDKDPNMHPIPMHIMGNNQQSVPWIHLRSMIYLFYTGLSYYLGVHARSLKVADADIKVYFGGRASALLTWMSSRARAFLPAMRRSLQIGLTRTADANTQILFPGLGVDPDFLGLAVDYHPEFPQLKTEVAKGLLVKSTALRDLSEKLDGSVAGEIGWTTRQGQKIDWQTWLKPGDYQNLIPPPDFESTTIGHYRAELLAQESFGRFHLNLDDDRLKALHVDRGYVQQLISDAADANGHASQPLFAYELKALMNAYANAVSQIVAAPAGTN
ncbi:hypothetical protein [Paracidobacterium acidisoli]|uniref:Uncharacterized protein n=1 Tax=Paracidobacterium acidisoli TaxID=2303751 RepID=A0A372IJ01_9BACT|nr:hypothetical protein [Paracidobacterium acidisoli]MBT9333145.1 rod shape-determining protein [Paracidobacterium acidisoli]